MKKYIAILFLLLTTIIFPKGARALEGTAELRSITNDDFNCFVASVQMMDLNYNVMVTCRNLLYPAGDDIFNYVLWANPTDGGRQIKLGALGLGRGHYKTKTSFANLYVTTEKDHKTKTPQGPVVMRGNVKPIELFDKPVTPGIEDNVEEKDEEQKPTPIQKPSTASKLLTGLRRAGIISVFLLVSVIGLVFVVTRKK